MPAIDRNVSPATKLDLIFSHICNWENSVTKVKNSTGGLQIDLLHSYAYTGSNYFGLSSRDEMVFYLDTLFKQGWLEKRGNQSQNVPIKVIFVCEKIDFEANAKHFDVRQYPFIKYSSFEYLTIELGAEIGAYIEA